MQRALLPYPERAPHSCAGFSDLDRPVSAPVSTVSVQAKGEAVDAAEIDGRAIVVVEKEGDVAPMPEQTLLD